MSSSSNWPLLQISVICLSILLVKFTLNMLFGRRSWNPKNLHCYITGGSQGLGLATARILVQKGAHVTIVARTESKLGDALAELETFRQFPEQKLQYVAHALDTSEDAEAALTQACVIHDGHAPDAIFTCAGTAKPMFLMDMTPKDFEDGMTNAFWLQAWTAFAGSKRMVKDGVKGKIVLISSTLGLMSFVGYSSYAPGKHALRGLGETLRSEFLLYGIGVHTFFPCTMYSPGYENEEKTKPQVTKKIEETDEGLTPEQAARSLIQGVEKGKTQIAADFLTNLFRASTRGASPRNNFFVDAFLDFAGFIGVPIWVSGVNKQVLAHRQEHHEYLAKRDFFS